MSAWKYIGPGLLLAAAGVGFYIVAKKTATAKPTPAVPDASYRAEVYQGDGGWFAQVYAGGTPSGPTIGPVPTQADAEANAASYIAAAGVDAFYTLRTSLNGARIPVWFFDGWLYGAKDSTSNGPYASKAIANAAGSTWVGRMKNIPTPQPAVDDSGALAP